MKYFVIFFVLVIGIMLTPQVFGSCTLLSCDDSAKLEEPNYRFVDFSYTQIIGESIKFILEKMGDDNCNSYNAEIVDEEGNFVLGWGVEISCDPIMNSIPIQTKIGYNENNPIIIENSGKYYLKLEFDDVSINQEFVVIQNHSGGSLDRTVYPVPWFELSPLKQFNSGVSFDKIECKDNLVLIQKYDDGSPACVKEQSIPKLVERNCGTSDNWIKISNANG